MSKGTNKKNVSLDMTAMCDMAFLLLTFFILTAQMKPKEPVDVDIPAATKADSMAKKNTIRISVEKGGKVYLSMGDKVIRRRVIEGFNKDFEMGLDEGDITLFEQTDMFGFPMKDAKRILRNINDEGVKQEGIPTDSTGGELKEWLLASIYEYDKDKTLLPKGVRNPTIAIHADRALPYKDMKRVLEVVQADGIKIDEFKLITNLESKQ